MGKANCRRTIEGSLVFKRIVTETICHELFGDDTEIDKQEKAFEVFTFLCKPLVCVPINVCRTITGRSQMAGHLEFVELLIKIPPLPAFQGQSNVNWLQYKN